MREWPSPASQQRHPIIDSPYACYNPPFDTLERNKAADACCTGIRGSLIAGELRNVHFSAFVILTIFRMVFRHKL